jgi:magnesium-transporting ATPase (P-type)
MSQHIDADLTLFNLIASACLLVGGLVSWFYLIPEYVTVRQGQTYGLSPAFIPQVATGLLILLSAALLVKTLRVRIGGAERLAEESEEGDKLIFGLREVTNVLLILLYSVAYVQLLQLTGFVIASMISLSTAMLFFRTKPYWLVIAVSLGVPLLLQTLLWYGLTVQLPGISFLK